jgi:LPS-assembly lipoprotein
MSGRGLTVLILSLMLTACGFRFQGDLVLPQAVRVIELQAVDRQSEFAHALARQLRSAGVEVRWGGTRSRVSGAGASGSATSGVGTATSGAVALLHIEADDFLERVASISARNLPREYELTYRVRYSYRLNSRAQGKTDPEILDEELSLSREFSFDERVALAKQREREQLRTTLANELAGMVLQRLASVR